VDDDTWVNPPNLAALVDGPLLANASFVGFGPIGSNIPFGGAGYFLSKAAQQALLRPANLGVLTDAGNGSYGPTYTRYHAPGRQFEEVLREHQERVGRERQRRQLPQLLLLPGLPAEPRSSGALPASSAGSARGQQRQQERPAAGEQQAQQQHGAAAAAARTTERRLAAAAPAADSREQDMQQLQQPGGGGQQSWIQACAAAKAGGPWCYFHSDWAVADCVRLATGGAVTPLTHVGGRRCSRLPGFGAGYGLLSVYCPPIQGGQYVTCHHLGPEDMLQREAALCAEHRGLPGC
jgi:hypothetical protein